MEWWMVVGLALVALLGFYFFLQTKLRANPVFLASYKRELERTGSREQALRWAISMFTRRSPFNQLTEADIDRLVETYSPLPDPRVLAELFHAADKAGDVTLLTNNDGRRQFADRVQSRQETSAAVTRQEGRPVLDREAVTDYDRVATFVSWFLANDQNVGVVRNRSTNIIFDEGHRPLVPVGTEPSALRPKILSAEEWFTVKVFLDLNDLASASKEEFRNFIDSLDEAGKHTLVAAGDLASTYDLNMERFDYEVEVEKIPPGAHREKFKVNLMQDNILSAEIRILAWLYDAYFRERYQLPENRT